MSLNDDVDLDEFINQKDDLSGADIKAICSEAGLMALRERRMRVQMADFRAARERVMVSWLCSCNIVVSRNAHIVTENKTRGIPTRALPLTKGS